MTTSKNHMKAANNAFILRTFVSNQQLTTIVDGYRRGEESEFFEEKLEEYATRVQSMHKTYEQDGKGDDAIVHLHYFKGGMDWYITERDVEEYQHQAFGKADLGHGGELGYISIEELKTNNVELDLHWTPVRIGDIK
jgi:E3 ubiquitin-protein ligase DOA10